MRRKNDHTIASVLTTCISLTSPSPNMFQSSMMAPQLVDTTPSFTILPLKAPTFTLRKKGKKNGRRCTDNKKSPSQVLFSASLPPLCHQTYKHIDIANVWTVVHISCHWFITHDSHHQPVIVKVSKVAVAGDQLLHIGSNRVVVDYGDGRGVAAFTLGSLLVALFLCG